MRDSPDAPPTFVLPRGRYDQPDRAQPVAPGAIEAVLPADPARMTDRRALAAWLTDPRNPLTARVEVNRLWAQLFGRGLVESNENFGLQGAWPSHPELLDALAHDFARGPHAWDRKALLRRLALSATFRQASSAAPAKAARDPRNALLSRGPAVRLTAEQLRDSALLASGLLVHRLGGPSVRPWQQPGLANDTGQGGNYVPDAGEGAHRRSLYTYRKRTVPPPTMLSFDAGTRESCQPRRSATNTPIQALALLNDPVFTECARALAARAARAAADRDARIVHAFRLLCTRAPRAAELEALRALVASQAAAFAADRGAAAQVAGSDDPELAALVLACSTIMASDGAVMSR